MTKEEKIKAAYIAEFTEGTEEQKNERYENIKSHIDAFGWFCGNVHKKNEENFDTSGHEIRPKSLQGIENNNGWIKIESENDLPKENVPVWTILENGNIYLQRYMSEYKDFSVHPKKYITHYQVVSEPKSPI